MSTNIFSFEIANPFEWGRSVHITKSSHIDITQNCTPEPNVVVFVPESYHNIVMVNNGILSYDIQ